MPNSNKKGSNDAMVIEVSVGVGTTLSNGRICATQNDFDEDERKMNSL